MSRINNGQALHVHLTKWCIWTASDGSIK